MIVGVSQYYTTRTALLGYLISSFSRVLDFINLEDPSSIHACGDFFISIFSLFPVTFGALINLPLELTSK